MDARIHDDLVAIKRQLERIATALERAHNVTPCFGAFGRGCDRIGHRAVEGYEHKFCDQCADETESTLQN